MLYSVINERAAIPPRESGAIERDDIMNDSTGAPALELRGLTHRYGKNTALDGVDLTLPAGHTYGLLGRNGAGKTTLLNVLSATLFPQAGQALIFGHKAFERANTLQKLCVVREKTAYPKNLRVRDALFACEGLYPNWDGEFALRLLDRFELSPKKRYRQLSRGMESSLGLVIGLASRADLTIFDEPSLGLDAVARERFYEELLHDFAEHPRTLVISTHLIDEVSSVIDSVVIIDKGRVLLQKSVDELRRGAITLTGTPEDVRQAIQGHEVLHEDVIGGVMVAAVYAREGEDFGPLRVDPLQLQKLFVYLTERGEA